MGLLPTNTTTTQANTSFARAISPPPESQSKDNDYGVWEDPEKKEKQLFIQEWIKTSPFKEAQEKVPPLSNQNRQNTV